MKVAYNLSHNSPLDDSFIRLRTWADFFSENKSLFLEYRTSACGITARIFSYILIGSHKTITFFFHWCFLSPPPTFTNIVTWDQLLGIMVVGCRNPFL